MMESDSVKNISLANEVSKKLNSGESGEDVLSKINANTPGKIQKEDIGYITVFTLPYKFENIIYGLKPGNASAPFPDKKRLVCF